LSHSDEGVGREELELIFRRIPKGIVPISYRSGELLAWIPEEHLRKLIRDTIYSELAPVIDVLVSRRLNQRISQIQKRQIAQTNLVGLGLCSMILVISVMLSALSFLAYNASGVGTAFLYAAVAALGGVAFISYRGAKEGRSRDAISKKETEKAKGS
jgi:hypothetical protein